MTHVPHGIAADFPEHTAQIHELQQDNARFRNLAAEYDEINHAVHRAETRLDALSEEAEAALRHRRAGLKDEIYRILSAQVS